MIWLVQLVFDCADPDAIPRFWGRALEYRHDLAYASEDEVAAFRAAYPQFEGRGRIDDRELRRPPVYVQRVPEPKRSRNRLRLELGVAVGQKGPVVEELIALGARPGDTPGELQDVEGNELSVVEDPATAERRLRSVVFDCLDSERMLEFWSAATGFHASEGRCDPGDIELVHDGGVFSVSGRRFLHITGMEATPTRPVLFDLSPGLAFVTTERPKDRKNRIHLDLNSTDAETDRERLTALGATVLRWDTDHVLADPEGNEFCLSPSRSPD